MTISWVEFWERRSGTRRPTFPSVAPVVGGSRGGGVGIKNNRASCARHGETIDRLNAHAHRTFYAINARTHSQNNWNIINRWRAINGIQWKNILMKPKGVVRNSNESTNPFIRPPAHQPSSQATNPSVIKDRTNIEHYR